MKKTYYVDITGNDTFFVSIKVEASNIELALAEALKTMDAYQRATVERLEITSIRCGTNF